jgi:phage tail sheath gpL-like
MGVIAYYGDDDPARPFQTLTIPGVLAPALEDRWSDFPEKNQALYEGCSVRGVNADGDVAFLNLITTYRYNELGAETQAYLQLNSILILSYLRYDWNNYLKLKYPRHKLTSDDNAKLVRPGQKIITPAIGKAEAICRMQEWVRQGLVEAPEDFKNRLIVERDEQNPNRLNWLIAPDLVNQFRIGATLIQYLL